MAQETVIVRLDFQGLDSATQDVGQLEQQIRKLRAEQKKLEKDTDNLTSATKDQTKQYGDLDIKIKELRKDKNNLTRDVQKLNAAEKANTNTIDGLTKRNRQLTAEMRKLDLTTNQGRARLQQLRTEFTANDQKVRQFDASLNRHQANVGNYKGGIMAATAGISAMVAGITAAVMAFQRINALMSESIELFKTQEVAERQLAFVAGESTDALIAQAQALQQVTTFGDEATIQMQALLMSFGSTAEQVETLTPLIQDYAVASGQDLSAAATKVNNILNGTSTTLKGTKIRLSETATATERYNAVLQQFSQYQGQAAALADTQAGRLDKLTNAYNDQKEELGEKLIPVKIAFQQGLLNSAVAVGELSKFLKENAALIAGFTATLAVYTAALSYSTIATKAKIVADKAAAAAQWLLNVAMGANPIGAVVLAVGALIGGLTALVTWIATSEKGMKLFNNVTELVSQGIEWLQANILNLLKVAFYPYIKGLELVTEGLSKLGLVSDGTASKIANLTEINFKQVESTKAAGAGWDNLTASIERTKEVEQRLAEDRAEREREANKRAAREEVLHQRELERIDEKRKANEGLEATEENIEGLEVRIRKFQSLEAAADALTQAEKELSESLKSVDELLTDVDLSFPEDEVKEPPIVSQADLAAQKLEKAQMALEELKGISLNDAINQLASMTEETTKFERNMVLIGASVTALNDIFATRFENQKQQIEQQTLAEKEAIEQSTISEEQKRIAIERAEQKKATEIEKIQQKQAKQQKANAIIESLINTALGITKALATFGPFAFGVIPAIAAIGAVQTGIIAAQQFAEGGQVAELGGGDGGLIGGHLANMPAMANGDNVLATVKTGEVILNKGQQQRLKALAGSNVFGAIGVPNFADGGVVPEFTSGSMASAQRIETASAEVAATVRDLRVVNVATETSAMALRVQNIENEATIG